MRSVADDPPPAPGSRVSRRRKGIAARGVRRVEVTVHVRDVPLIRAIAGALRAGGEEAETIRRSLRPILAAPGTRTGAELVAFLRASPLADIELTLERDRSAGRSADLG